MLSGEGCSVQGGAVQRALSGGDAVQLGGAAVHNSK